MTLIGRCGSQMAEGVAIMHDYSIIHRDIKGENFVFVEDPAHAAANGRAPAVKIIDLGMSITHDPKVPVIGEAPHHTHSLDSHLTHP